MLWIAHGPGRSSMQVERLIVNVHSGPALSIQASDFPGRFLALDQPSHFSPEFLFRFSRRHSSVQVNLALRRHRIQRRARAGDPRHDQCWPNPSPLHKLRIGRLDALDDLGHFVDGIHAFFRSSAMSGNAMRLDRNLCLAFVSQRDPVVGWLADHRVVWPKIELSEQVPQVLTVAVPPRRPYRKRRSFCSKPLPGISRSPRHRSMRPRTPSCPPSLAHTGTRP